MFKHFREVLALAVTAIWAGMVCFNPRDPLIIGASIALVSSVSNFFFGSTKTGAETATKNADAVTQNAIASNIPQPVVVTNDPSQAVPVETK